LKTREGAARYRRLNLAESGVMCGELSSEISAWLLEGKLGSFRKLWRRGWRRCVAVRKKILSPVRAIPQIGRA
jgi:hypothetical protein